jgi:hypothetical protein
MQIQVTEQQAAELRRRARTQGTSLAAIVRKAIDHELMTRSTNQDAWERALSAVGSAHGGGGNVGRDHDAYLADAYAGD